MQTNQILSADLIDIIFDGRNKAYGAYELRVHYSGRIKRAMLFTLLAAGLGFGSVVMARSFQKNEPRFQVSESLSITEIANEKKQEPLPEQPKPQQPEQPVETIRNTTPEVKPDEEVDTPPPSQTDMQTARIDTDTRAGVPDEGIPGTADPGLGNETAVFEEKPVPAGPAEVVDVDARFDGNWKRFLEGNLNAEVPVNNSAPAGRYSVVIRFVVDVDGSVSDIQPLTAHGYGLEEEAVRVIRKSKKWEPAFLNGKHVKAYKKQVVVFEVMEE